MKSYLYFIIAATFWGLNLFCVKIMLKEVNFAEVGLWRYIFGVITLAFLCIRCFPKLKDLKDNFVGASLVGIIGLFGFNFFYFLSLIDGSAITIALILSLTPTFSLIFSFLFFKTELKAGQIIGVIFSFIGVFYLVVKGHILNIEAMKFNISDLYILLGSFMFALHNLWVKKFSHNTSHKTFTLITAMICLVCFIIITPFYGIKSVTTHGSDFWLSALGLGVLGTAIAYFLWNQGIKIKGANQGAIFMNFIPISAALLGEFFFQEKLHEYHLISGVLIISGLIITNMKLKKPILKRVKSN
ncbi:DMT family transporter [Aureivirga sp. CE67]|uniref:DMT family transporter n=1 Tax=Aureivirga sp. CE67 TaxID=1788983 RepID=UPI0018C8EAF8|nr:DMT family transporter [Aureivirga sp. CE67]